jgi:cytochrome c biogenesis protein CcmG, thiol:disulfide interchange protein DsbE
MTFSLPRLGALLAVAAGLSLVPCLPSIAIPSGQMYNFLVQAPNFTLTNAIDGEAVSLSEFGGKVRLVTFWASWCPSCRKEIPALINLQERYGKQGLQVLAINNDPKDVLQRDVYVRKMGFNFPSLVTDGRVGDEYGRVNKIPTTFVIGRKGNIYKHYVGAYPEATLEADIKRLL